MYDRRSRTLWQSLTGEPVVGRLAYSGIKLRLLPLTVTTWADWLSQHPGTKALSLETGHRFFRYLKPGEPGSQYYDYYASPDVMFPPFRQSPALKDKSDVFALEIGAAAKAYPLPVLARELVVNDTVGGRDIVIAGHPSDGAARAYDRAGHRFTRTASPEQLLDESGAVWVVRDDGLVTRDAPVARLDRIPGYTLFWFGWYAFRPHTEIYSGR